MVLSLKTTGVLALVFAILAIPLINQMLFTLFLGFFLGLLVAYIVLQIFFKDVWLANVAGFMTFCAVSYYVSVVLLKLF